MRIEAIELRQLEIPMIEPLAAAYGTTGNRITILVHVITDIGSGWGECVALNEPIYSADWSNGEWTLLKEIFVPTMLNAGDVTAEDVASVLAPYKYHHTSRAAMEMAVLDAQLKAENKSLASYFDSTSESVACCIVVGLEDGDELVRLISKHLNAGYKMLKLKVEPGHDVHRIDLVRKEFPGLTIRLDANGAYDWYNDEHRKALMEIDERNVVLIEQPFVPDRAFPLAQYRLKHTTPVALDESINSWEKAMNTIEMDLADVLAVKPGMLGGYLVAKRVQTEAQRRGVKTMVGGMLETAIARSANLALAASSDNEDYPAEISPDGRWFNECLNVNPVEMIDGHIKVPTEPGFSGELDWVVMDKLTRRFHVARAGSH